MNNNLTLYPAKTENLMLVNELMRNSKKYWDYDEEFMKKYMDIFQITNHYLRTSDTWLLYENKNLIGFFGLSMNSDNLLELGYFFIAPNYIGKGFGRILWEHVIATVKNLNKSEFILWSDPGAEGFYKKMGCIKIGSKKSPIMPNRNPAIFQYII
ncbi:putative acetyltransferase [Legionella birminghamensis]|uniref:Acetyltransferase n=1 Tax=Legionella birminghamensis TaxID=28083 RepID=A0A378I780_9GAMM|nr:GNAT family N-acetyltransferase [Legionella birminghamensis]KTC68222.1 putative acetyltransferase [Legionella birminghamensis]STX31067.1 putative acetyltransferase [Legionella birminghamensis]